MDSKSFFQKQQQQQQKKKSSIMLITFVLIATCQVAPVVLIFGVSLLSAKKKTIFHQNFSNFYNVLLK